MGRPKRIEAAGLSRHITARGVERRRIFVDDDDYQTYMRLMASVVHHYGLIILAFCLMPNHVHLMVETTAPNLGKAMQWLQHNYSLAFNRRVGRGGHLYEARYRSSKPIEDEGHFLRTVGYIVTNASRAKLCATPADWPWGSHHLVIADSIPSWLSHDRLLERVEALGGPGCYERFIQTYERERY